MQTVVEEYKGVKSSKMLKKKMQDVGENKGLKSLKRPDNKDKLELAVFQGLKSSKMLNKKIQVAEEENKGLKSSKSKKI